jgi:Domain of unknown function (DUF4148)
MSHSTSILLAAALTSIAGLASAQANYNPERGPQQFVNSQSVDRASVVSELNAARTAGTLTVNEFNYPRDPVNSSSQLKRAEVKKEAATTNRMRIEAARTGANGYLPG